MNGFEVDVPKVSSNPGGTSVSFSARWPGGQTTVEFSHNLTLDGVSLPAEMLGNAAVAIFLLPAMRLGLPLQLHPAVSPSLQANIPTLQSIFRRWYPETFTGEVGICCTAGSGSKASPQRGTSCFFSGGVDSFYSVLKQKNDLTHLIFVHGFDIPLQNAELGESVTARLRGAAAELGLPLVEVQTNVREFSDDHLHWGSHFCGAALAAVAHLLSPWIQSAFVPASVTYDSLLPFGTHIYTDELWSGDELEIIHDGMEAPRMEKMRILSGDPVARRHLRVCWKNHDGKYNCGRCEKCVRTMANLRALQVLPLCTTFPQNFDLDAFANLEIDHPVIVPFVEQTRQAALEAGDEALARAAKQCLMNELAKRLARDLTPVREQLVNSVVWRTQALPRFRDAILESCWRTDEPWTRQEVARHLSTDPDKALELLWQKDRSWMIRQWVKHTLKRWLPPGRSSESKPPSTIP